MRIFVLIPVINLWKKYTLPCIQSIKSKHELRILLIDNGSTDETKNEAAKLTTNFFHYHRNNESWSCSKSWNFGMKDAFERGYDYFLVLNNDVLLHPECIDKMVDRFELEKEAVRKKSEELRQPLESNLVLVAAMDIRGHFEKPEDIFTENLENYKDCPESENPNFSAFMVNKKFMNEIGEFDEEFVPCYFEDNSCHYKIRLKKLKAICYPSALFHHFGSKTWNEGLVHTTTEGGLKFERNREMYVKMWGGTPGNETYNTKFNK